MVSASDIQATCDDIVREFSPLQVILFGSYAYGNPPTEDSDVDLLVVMDILKSKAWQQRCEMHERLPKRFPLDLHVRCPEDIAYRIAHNDWFLRDVFEKGQVLYEAEVLKCRKRQHWQAFTLLAGCMPPFPVTQRNRNVDIDNVDVGLRRRTSIACYPLSERLANDRKANDRKLGFAADALVPIWQETGVMNPLTLERVQNAEDDWTMLQLAQQAPRPLRAPICFHAQQCVEKYLKVWLQEANLRVPRTHDLNALLELIVPTHPQTFSQWRAWHADFEKFKPHAVDVRYGDYSADEADVAHAVRVCTEVRREIRAALQLPNDETDA